MFALLLVGALIGQTLCAPKPNCGGASLCDHTSGRQITGQNAGGYSSYSKWGSSSSWSSGNVDSGYGTTNPARLETFDEGNVIGTTGRQGNWKDEKSYVTDDRKGKIDYKAGQEVTGNSFKKYAQSSYSYGTNANHDVNGAEIIPHTQFESQIQDVQREITAFIGQFTFSSSSVVTQSTLDNFKREAQRLTNQVTNLCDRADRNSEEYHRLQRIKQNLEQSVQIKQQQIMNFAFESSHSISGSISSTGGSQYVEPQPQPPRYYAPTTPNPQVVRSERIQTECNQLRNEIDAFYSKFVTADFSSYDREDTLATFRAQVNAEIEAIKQKVANLKIESVNFDYQHKFVEDLSRTFNQYSQNVVQNVDNCEQRIREKQRALIEAEQRRVQERLEQQKLEIKQKYEESLRIAQEEHERQQKEIQELQQQEAARIEQQKFEAEQRYKQEQERIRILQQQQQPAPLPQVEYHPQQTVSPTVDVSQNGAWSHKYDVHISGSQHHELSASGSGGSTSGQQVRYNQPIQIGPHIDMTEIQNKMNQEFNRIVNSVSGLSSYSMQLTESNQNTINAQFQQEFNNLRQKIDNLCQESSQYHNDRLLQASENLKKTLEQSAQYFRQEFAKLSSSGSLQDNSSWQASGRYTNVKQPHVSNVEYSHSKSTEFELSGNRGHGNQQVICVEQYAGQPCIEPVTVRRRRQAGGK